MITPQPMLRLKNISKVYNGNGNNAKGKNASEHVVLDKLNLDIKKGEFLTIVGPSGCGKSTLLNIISEIDNSYGGEILIDEKPISESKFSDRSCFSRRCVIPMVNS